jgi:prepilin-type N-terminal cleavage/methylation domain-containing protein
VGFLRSRAFTLVEVLISMVIVAILGGAVVMVLWVFFNVFSQTEDYGSSRQEIEFAIQVLGREITNVSLGMPNNKLGNGQDSFAESFRRSETPSEMNPIMEQMGDSSLMNREWGGPITLASGDNPLSLANKVKDTTKVNGVDEYVGTCLYYAWGVPTGLRVNKDQTGEFRSGESRTFTILEPDGVDRLRSFQYEGRAVGILDAAEGKNSARCWMLFPTLRVPMLIRSISRNTVTVELMPSVVGRGGHLGGLEEIYLAQVRRLYVNEAKELVQEDMGGDFTDASTRNSRVLAHNIAAVGFTYDRASRVLSMYIAARGANPTATSANGNPAGWPEEFPPLSAEDLRYRIVVENLAWRIRN